jgi:simple sugar transport system permease protein
MRLRLVPREDLAQAAGHGAGATGRRWPGAWRGLRVAAGALVASLLAGAALLHLAGAPPLAALATLLGEPFGSLFGLSETLLVATPLILCGLSVATAHQVGMWNIGAEGQLYLGAFAATGAALHLPVPAPASLVIAALAGALAGALWALVPALLRTYAGVSEILTTLLLNYVAMAWVAYWIYGPWKGADGFPYTAYFDPAWHLPVFLQRAHVGLFAALALAGVLAWVLGRTALGYEVRVIGASPAAARYAGMPAAGRTVTVLVAAGALAGLAGSFEVTGVAHRLHASLSPGYGYTAIIVAFLARSHLLAVPLVAIAFAALAVGGEALQIAHAGLSAAAVDALQGMLLVSVLAGQALARHRLIIERREPRA